MRFLVIDDSVMMRRIIVNALQRIGYTDSVEAADGPDALAKLDASIDFIVTNWNMPLMTGLELAHAVRRAPGGSQVPILMVTTRGALDDITAAVEAGVDGYIIKPFTPSVLKEKIHRLLAGRGAAAYG